MTVNYDVVIKSGNSAVDMDYALETLSGASDVTCLLAEAILRKRVVQRRTSSSPARAVLHQSFKSSYGQNFELIITDPKLNARLTEMTNSVFTEIMSFYISEALYIQNPPLSERATQYIEFNYKTATQKRKVVNLDSRTASNLTYTETKRERITITAVVTRFNSRTGNGRLVLQDEDDTVAFGFYVPCGAVPSVQKKIMSLNLHNNNGRRDNFVFLSMVVSRVVIKSGETVKYLVHSARVLEQV